MVSQSVERVSCDIHGQGFEQVAEGLRRVGRQPLVICDRNVYDSGLTYLKPHFDGIVRGRYVLCDPRETAAEVARMTDVAVAERCDSVIGVGIGACEGVALAVARAIRLPSLLVFVSPQTAPLWRQYGAAIPHRLKVGLLRPQRTSRSAGRVPQSGAGRL